MIETCCTYPFTGTTIKISILAILVVVRFIVAVAMEKGGQYHLGRRRDDRSDDVVDMASIER